MRPEPVRRTIAGLTPRRLLGWTLALVAAVFASTFAVALGDRLLSDPAEQGRAFFYLFARNEPAAALAGILVLLITALPSGRWLGDRAYALVLFAGRRPRRIVAAGALLLPLSAAFAYQRFPIALDEWMPLVQARIFAAGEIFGRYPPALLLRSIPYGFIDFFYLVNPYSGAFISAYWPGHALLLTPFVLSGVPWLLTPLLGIAALLLVHELCRHLSRRRTAVGWCLLLFLGSASFVVNASSFYSMTAHLVANLAFVLLLQVPSRRRLVAAGVVGSWALVLHQPIFHPLVAAPWLLRMASQRRWRDLAWLALGYAPLTLILGVGWLLLRQTLSGAWNQFAQEARLPGSIGMGATFGESNPVLGMFRGLAKLMAMPRGEALRVEIRSQLELWSWSVPGLPLLAAAGAWWARRSSEARCLAWSFAATWITFFWIGIEQGHGWGYRYLDAAWWVLPVLAALALSDPRLGRWRRRVAAVVVLALAVLVPLRLVQVHSLITEIRRQAPALTATQPTLVLIDTAVGFYRKDLVRNDPFLRDDVVTMIAVDAERDAALAASLLENSRLVARFGKDSIWTGTSWQGLLARAPGQDRPLTVR